MTDIPEDVMKSAREAHAEFAKSSVRDNLTVIIARAILAERERCARIAESVGNYGDYKREELTKDYGQPRFDLMHEIAAKIRSVDK